MTDSDPFGPLRPHTVYALRLRAILTPRGWLDTYAPVVVLGTSGRSDAPLLGATAEWAWEGGVDDPFARAAMLNATRADAITALRSGHRSVAGGPVIVVLTHASVPGALTWDAMTEWHRRDLAAFSSDPGAIWHRFVTSIG